MANKKMDDNLIAWGSTHEVKTVCRLFRITETDLTELVRRLPRKHSRLEVYALLLGAGYSKHPRKKALP